jgi:hypothetical protein
MACGWRRLLCWELQFSLQTAAAGVFKQQYIHPKQVKLEDKIYLTLPFLTATSSH